MNGPEEDRIQRVIHLAIHAQLERPPFPSPSTSAWFSKHATQDSKDTLRMCEHIGAWLQNLVLTGQLAEFPTDYSALKIQRHLELMDTLKSTAPEPDWVTAHICSLKNMMDLCQRIQATLDPSRTLN